MGLDNSPCLFLAKSHYISYIILHCQKRREIRPGDSNMYEDDVDNDHMDDFEPSEDIPAFTAEDLADLYHGEETGADSNILIEGRSISNLAEITAVANEHIRPITIEECVLNEVEIDSINVDMCVDESIFTEEVYFKKGILGGKLIFWDAAFQKKADFTQSIFKKEIRFENCTFHSGVSFARATFENGAAFVSCVFKGDIVFDHARFAGQVDFTRSTFKKKAAFKGARFSQVVDLRDVEFKEGADTTDSNLMEMEKAAQAKKRTPPKTVRKKGKQRAEFNPWRKLDQASKKSMSRREMLRGIFRFLPEKEEK